MERSWTFGRHGAAAESDGADGDADDSSAVLHRERADMTASRTTPNEPHTPSPISPSASSPAARAHTHPARAPRPQAGVTNLR